MNKILLSLLILFILPLVYSGVPTIYEGVYNCTGIYDYCLVMDNGDNFTINGDTNISNGDNLEDKGWSDTGGTGGIALYNSSHKVNGSLGIVITSKQYVTSLQMFYSHINHSLQWWIDDNGDDAYEMVYVTTDNAGSAGMRRQKGSTLIHYSTTSGSSWDPSPCTMKVGLSKFLMEFTTGGNIEHTVDYDNGTICTVASLTDNTRFADSTFIDRIRLGIEDGSTTFMTVDDIVYCNGTGGCGFTGVTAPPPSITGIVSATFKNITDDEKVVFGEGEDFSIQLNYTLSNGTISPNATCNVSVYGGIIETNVEPENFNICDSGCDYDTFDWSYNATPAETTGVNDSVHILICHATTPSKSANLNVQCAGYNNDFTIPKNSITLCEDGFSEFFYYFNDCLTDDVINISLTNTASSLHSHNISKIDLYREFNPYFEEYVFNSSSSRYVTDHLYEFYKHGLKTVDYNCSLSDVLDATISNSTLLTIVNAPPKITFSSVEIQGNFTNINETGINMFRFINGTYNFIVSITDHNLDTVLYTFYNKSGDEIQSNSPNITSQSIVEFSQQPYNLSVFANDTSGNSTYKSILFNTTDLILPRAYGIENISVVNGTSYDIDVNFTDDNFFKFNVTCSNGFTSSRTGLNLAFFNYQNSTTITGNTTCTWTYCDGHTLDSLKNNWNIKEKSDTLELWVNNRYKVYFNCPGALSIKAKQKTDRISYDVEYPSTGWHTCFYKPYDGFYLKGEYEGWIVDNYLNTWFDTEPYQSTIFMHNQSYFEIEYLCDKKKCSFESIGELNCVTQEQFIEAIYLPVESGDTTLETNRCPTSIPGVMMLALVYAILFVMLWINIRFLGKIRIVSIFIGLGLFILGMTMIACSGMIALISGLFGGFLILWGFLGKVNW